MCYFIFLPLYTQLKPIDMDIDYIIKNNPSILGDEQQFPNIITIYREHYRKKHNGSYRRDRRNYIPIHLETKEEREERMEYEYLSMMWHDEETDVVGGELSALSNIE